MLCGFSGAGRHVYARSLEAVKQFGLPLDTVANEYSDARKLLDGVALLEARFYAGITGRE